MILYARMLEFKMFRPEDALTLKPFFNKIDTYCYEYNLSYLLLWREVEDIHYAITADDELFIYQKASKSFLLPLSNNISASIEKLYSFCKEANIPFFLKSVPSEALSFFSSEYTVEHDRDLDDYLYTPEKLIGLHGKHLQAKRNHISQFEKGYTFTVEKLNRASERECIEMDNHWTALHEEFSQEVQEEKMAIVNSFKFWDELDLKGLALRIDGKIAAFTIGEIVRDGKEAIVHFEKGDINYMGIYAAINNLFCKEYLENVTYIDRQEDVGIEGLRKSKLSYHPDTMAEKYRVCRAL